MICETELYSELQAMKQDNAQTCKEFEMAVCEHYAMIRASQDTVVQRDGVIHHYQAAMNPLKRQVEQTQGSVNN